MNSSVDRPIPNCRQVCIPYIDPALMQTRQQVFQLTYGFTCCCTSCKFLEKIGSIPIGGPELEKPLRDFIGVDNYLKTGSLSEKTVEQLPPSLYPVLNEAFMTNLSERFSKASHEGDYDEAARSGITLLALYLLVYPRNYPQIGWRIVLPRYDQLFLTLPIRRNAPTRDG